MFKDIFPDKLNRFVYKGPRRGTPKKKEVAGAQPKPKPKPKSDQQAEGHKVLAAYERGVWDMLTGGSKGKYSHKKLLREFFVAGAIEIAIKELVRHKPSPLLERLGLGDLEGAYEAVLIQDAQKEKKMDVAVHARALHELNNVPFYQVMEWYENSDSKGLPHKGGKDLFPMQINLSKLFPKIGPLKTQQRKTEDARRAVWQTVDHFFRYAGGKEALKKRWVTMIEKIGIKKKDASWQLVMRTEIDPSKVAFGFDVAAKKKEGGAVKKEKKQ